MHSDLEEQRLVDLSNARRTTGWTHYSRKWVKHPQLRWSSSADCPSTNNLLVLVQFALIISLMLYLFTYTKCDYYKRKMFSLYFYGKCGSSLLKQSNSTPGRAGHPNWLSDDQSAWNQFEAVRTLWWISNIPVTDEHLRVKGVADSHESALFLQLYGANLWVHKTGILVSLSFYI